MRLIERFFLIIAMCAIAGPAAAQSAYSECNNLNLERRIAGCTLVIDNAGQSPKNRANAYFLRGLGHERKGDFVQAIADFDQAIKLNIDNPNVAKRREYVLKKKEHLDRAAVNLGLLDGTWEGELQAPEKDGSTKPTWQRIVINGSDAKVFIRSEGDEREIKPAAFQVHRHLANAVILAIDSALDDDGLWIETWSFTVTLKDRNTLIANFSRVVNNANLPLSVAHSKFSSTATGELRRK